MEVRKTFLLPTLACVLALTISPLSSWAAEKPDAKDTQNRDEEIVFVGKCIAVQAQWIGKSIFTDATFEVSRMAKGPPLEAVTVRTLGGKVEEPVPVRAVVFNGVQFEIGETAVLRARHVAEDVYRVDRPEQKRGVQVDEQTGEPFVTESGTRTPLPDYLEHLLAELKQEQDVKGR